MDKKTASLAAVLLALFVLSGCAGSPPVASTRAPAQTPTPPPAAASTFTPAPTATTSPARTPTITVTPTLTPTPTITRTPALPYPGGALILFAGVEVTDNGFAVYCGAASADGKILIKESLEDLNGDMLRNESGMYNQPSIAYCPPGSRFGNLNRWSPDRRRLVFYVQNSISKEHRLYLTRPGRSRHTFLMKFKRPDGKYYEYGYAPKVHWLGNEAVWFYDEVQETSTILNVDTREAQSFPYQITSASRDGETLTYLEGETLYLRPAAGQGEASNLDQFALEQGITLLPYYKKLPVWSPDGEQVAFFAETGAHSTWAVFNRRGRFLTRIGAEREGFYIRFAWSPASDRILAGCQIKRAGESTEENMCLYSRDGEKIKEYPWEPYRQSLGEITADGRSIDYLLSEAPAGLGTTHFNARLYRMDIESGERVLLGENLQDLSWISAYWLMRLYERAGLDDNALVRESPDGALLLLNDAGRLFKIGGGWDPKTRLVFAVICRAGAACRDFQLDGMNIIGAAWWVPPERDWRP